MNICDPGPKCKEQGGGEVWRENYGMRKREKEGRTEEKEGK